MVRNCNKKNKDERSLVIMGLIKNGHTKIQKLRYRKNDKKKKKKK